MKTRYFILNSEDQIYDGPFRSRGAAEEVLRKVKRRDQYRIVLCETNPDPQTRSSQSVAEMRWL